MNKPTRIPVNGPQGAVQGTPRPTVGEPKVAARKGVLSALRPDPQQDVGRYPVAWLHIAAPRGAPLTATSRCECGWDRSAVGHTRVLALIEDHTTHRDRCPLRNLEEGREAG
jgi:hypothetical protein